MHFFVGANGVNLELCKICLCGYKAREKFAPIELQIHTIFRQNFCPFILPFQTHLPKLQETAIFRHFSFLVRIGPSYLLCGQITPRKQPLRTKAQLSYHSFPTMPTSARLSTASSKCCQEPIRVRASGESFQKNHPLPVKSSIYATKKSLFFIVVKGKARPPFPAGGLRTKSAY